jgi:uncharacterized protein (UPF0332 family)
MFYVAEALLDHEGLALSSHAAVISKFGQTFAKTGKLPSESHCQIIDAQAQCTQADYDPNSDLTQQYSELLVQQALAFLATGQQFLLEFRQDFESTVPGFELPNLLHKLKYDFSLSAHRYA